MAFLQAGARYVVHDPVSERAYVAVTGCRDGDRMEVYCGRYTGLWRVEGRDAPNGPHEYAFHDVAAGIRRRIFIDSIDGTASGRTVYDEVARIRPGRTYVSTDPATGERTRITILDRHDTNVVTFRTPAGIGEGRVTDLHLGYEVMWSVVDGRCYTIEARQRR